jgi:IS30 family transposase
MKFQGITRITVFAAFATIFSCNSIDSKHEGAKGADTVFSSEEKMDSAIHEYIKTNINDYSSYQSIAFRKPRIDSITLSDEPVYQKLKSDEADISRKYSEFDANTTPRDFGTYKYLNGKKAIADSGIRIEKNILAFIHNFKSRPCGWGITHVFRRKNKGGGIVLDSAYFRFDSSYNLRSEDYSSWINRD